MAYRKEKLEEQIRRVVSELMIKEIKDPRIGFASITGVKLSNDKKSAKIGISIMGNPGEIRNSFAGLKSARGFIQHRLGKAMKIRYTPKLDFYLDSSVSDAVKMVDMLEKLTSSKKNNKEEY